MNVNQRIIRALEGLGPVFPDVYTGPEATYFTFNYTARGALFSDDAPGYDVYFVQVHLFCPLGLDSVELRKNARLALYEAGFTWPDVVNAADGSMEKNDADKQHFVFECEIEEGVQHGPI